MTVRSLGGLAGLGAVFLAVGLAVVWATCPSLTRGALLRLAGLAYLLGLATLGIAWTLLLVVGIPFGTATILVSAAVAVGACAAVGRRLGRPLPTRAKLVAAGWRTILAAVAIALLGLLGEVLFRAGRLEPLTAFDAWAFWIPKAKAIYFFGGLDVQTFTELVNANYPPLLPAVDAAAFHAMGSTDLITLHLLHWSYAVAFTWACAGLLVRRVPGWILWPFLAVLVTTPRIFARYLIPEADLLLDFLIATAAVLVGLWLVERRTELLVLATVLLCAGVCTKREGTAFAGTVLVAALIASRGRYRYAAVRLGLAAAVVLAVGIPWRIWYLSHDIKGETPPVTGIDLQRAWDSLRLSTETILDIQLWGLTPSLAVAAIFLGALFGSRRLALYAGVVSGGLFLWGAFSTYSFRELEISTNPGANPIIRLTAGAVIAAGVLAPMVVASVWRRHASRESESA